MFLLALLPARASAGLAGSPAADRLEEVLSKMDAAAARFRALTAQLSYTKVTLVVDDRTTETGSIYFKKDRGGKGFKVLIEFTQPEPKTVLFRDNKASIYYPKIAQIEEYDLGKNRERVEQFLLLGFGAPGHELLKAYSVTLAGEMNLNGTPTVKLDLTPQGSLTRNLRKVELWLSRDTWQPVQQQFTEPSGDYLITHYSDVRETPGLPDSQFQIKTSGKVKRVRPQE